MKALHALDGNQVAELVEENNNPIEETTYPSLDMILGSFGMNFVQLSAALGHATPTR